MSPKQLKLDWHSVKELGEQVHARATGRGWNACANGASLGIDEISVRKGHDYRIVVSDLIRERPIWFGGADRSEARMTQFYQWLGDRKCGRIRLAVMDMWKPFRKATNTCAPQDRLLSRKENLTLQGRQALRTLLRAKSASTSRTYSKSPCASSGVTITRAPRGASLRVGAHPSG
jgi:transposase